MAPTATAAATNMSAGSGSASSSDTQGREHALGYKRAIYVADRLADERVGVRAAGSAAAGDIFSISLPITAEHSPPTQSGFVQYGSNTIGSLSCFPPTRAISAPQVAAPPPPPSARASP